ncbi:MAG TPA: hypothetical protein VFU57_00210 [Candidatus Acidoferrales bacterium]|nr:hypothetical protein [Candidatus Acidoferrales bacterium]
MFQMSEELRDATPEELALEAEIQRFEAETAFRQSNILPLDQAQNLGRFYGLLIRASRPRSALERIGFLFIGLLWLGEGAFASPIGAAFALLGLKLLWTAFVPAEREPAQIA